MSEPANFPELLAGGWRKMAFEPFSEGVEIAWLSNQGEEGGTALLRYVPGASVPRHLHVGLETIVVLDGEQSDDRGTYPAGTVITNPPGYTHAVWTETGCTILICWNKPVQFV